MPLSRSSRKQKVPSHWDVLDGSEKFIIVFIIATVGFLIYMMVK